MSINERGFLYMSKIIILCGVTNFYILFDIIELKFLPIYVFHSTLSFQSDWKTRVNANCNT
jgi:hypothetical protein